MSTYRIGSINAHNIQVGDHNTQNNTQVGIDTELAKLDAVIDRHASLLPNVEAAHLALDALRAAYAAQPVDARRVSSAADELTAATVDAPAVHAEIAQLLTRIAQ